MQLQFGQFLPLLCQLFLSDAQVVALAADVGERLHTVEERDIHRGIHILTLVVFQLVAEGRCFSMQHLIERGADAAVDGEGRRQRPLGHVELMAGHIHVLEGGLKRR